jgi:hypothetical protein
MPISEELAAAAKSLMQASQIAEMPRVAVIY